MDTPEIRTEENSTLAPKPNWKPTKVQYFALSVIFLALAVFVATKLSPRQPQETVQVSPATSSPAPVLSVAGPCADSLLTKPNQFNPVFVFVGIYEKCTILLPLTGYSTVGYSVVYPQEWFVNTVGVERFNLVFRLDQQKDDHNILGVYLTTGNLSLENAYQATYGYERSAPQPFVAPEEVVISKQIVKLGTHNALQYKTELAGETLTRYFLVKQNPENAVNTIFMFELPTDSQLKEFMSEEQIQSLKASVEEVVSSTKFLSY